MAITSASVITTVDPNLPLPPNVLDLQYKNVEEAADSPTARSSETGEIVNVDYDEVPSSTIGTSDGVAVDAGTEDKLYPPDSVTVVSQTVRIASDGRAVVDVVLEIDSNIAGVTYDVRVTKP